MAKLSDVKVGQEWLYIHKGEMDIVTIESFVPRDLVGLYGQLWVRSDRGGIDCIDASSLVRLEKDAPHVPRADDWVI